MNHFIICKASYDNKLYIPMNTNPTKRVPLDHLEHMAPLDHMFELMQGAQIVFFLYIERNCEHPHPITHTHTRGSLFAAPRPINLAFKMSASQLAPVKSRPVTMHGEKYTYTHMYSYAYSVSVRAGFGGDASGECGFICSCNLNDTLKLKMC